MTPLLDSRSEFLGGRLYDRGQDDSADVPDPIDAVLDDMRYSTAINVTSEIHFGHPGVDYYFCILSSSLFIT